MTDVPVWEEGDTPECDCCRFDGPGARVRVRVFDRFEKVSEGPKTVNLCTLCASTMASNFDQYPWHDSEITEVLKSICHVGNVILDAVLGLHENPKE